MLQFLVYHETIDPNRPGCLGVFGWLFASLLRRLRAVNWPLAVA